MCVPENSYSDASGNKLMLKINDKISAAGYQIKWFNAGDPDSAFSWLLNQLDTNGNGVYDPGYGTTKDQPRNIDIFGWSWGGISAAELDQKIAQSSKFGSSTIDTIFDIDPVSKFRPGNHSIWSNVQNFYDFYQTNPNGIIGVPVLAPAPLMGEPLASSAAFNDQIDEYPSVIPYLDHFTIVTYAAPFLYQVLLGVEL